MIATADGVVEAEKVLLRNYAKKFGFIEENIDDIVNILLEYAQEKKSVNEILKHLS